MILTVSYPKTESSHFDFEYYVTKHMPMVRARWEPMGMVEFEVLRGLSTLDGGAPAFSLIGKIAFNSPEIMAAALSAHGGEIIGDIPNFSDVQPLMQVNEALA